MVKSSKDCWERNIEGFAGFYDKGSEENIQVPFFFKYIYKFCVFPIEKYFMKKRYEMVSRFIDENIEIGTFAADIGAESGVFSIIMVKKGAEVLALDYTEGALNLIKRNIPPNLGK